MALYFQKLMKWKAHLVILKLTWSKATVYFNLVFLRIMLLLLSTGRPLVTNRKNRGKEVTLVIRTIERIAADWRVYSGIITVRITNCTPVAKLEWASVNSVTKILANLSQRWQSLKVHKLHNFGT
jgi:hypothetical protein